MRPGHPATRSKVTADVSKRRAGALGCLLVLVAALLAAGCRTRSEGGEERPPRLVVVIAIDQGIPERLDPSLPGGLGRLAREGRVFTDAAHEHARTETCPGHVVMLTGMQPGRAGIPGNRFIVNGTREVRYCVQEDGPDGRLLVYEDGFDVQGGAADAPHATPPGAGRSPRQIRADALGDWMKTRWPEAKVFSVSAKDRAAIALGGQAPDAAYWLDRSGSGAFTTSRYYMPSLPVWVSTWARVRVLQGLPADWDYRQLEFPPTIREDDDPYESDRFSRVAPHPVVSSDPEQRSLGPVEVSPWLDTKTLDFALELAEREGLGSDATPDLLAVSLSGTDIIGHHYGPYSQEAWAAIRRLDDDLDGFIREMKRRAGRDELLVVLSSDHGVLPVPEHWARYGGEDAPCPIEGGRIRPEDLEQPMRDVLIGAFGEAGDALWVRDDYTFGFDAEGLEREGIELAHAIRVARVALEASPAITRTWTRPELMTRQADTDPYAQLYRNQLAEGRGGDLFAQPVRGCLVTHWTTGTSHGSPHDYDLDVPLVFWGRGVERGSVPGRAAPVDIAPTLAEAIGLDLPTGLDGRPLPLVDAR